MDTNQDDEPNIIIDPAQQAAVDALRASIATGKIELPGIGTATIVSSSQRVKESFPPIRETRLELTITHRA